MCTPSLWRNHCTLCGIRFDRGKRRFQEWGNILEFLRKRCKPSPFVHRLLVQDEGQGIRALCIPCVNWKRRVEGTGLKRIRTPPLQIDHLIMYLMQPGRQQEPDHRCMERLIRAVRQDDNPFLSALPLPAQSIVRRLKGDSYGHVVAAWWDYNGKSEFFQSAQEARRVRCAIKQGLISVDLEL